MFAALTAGGMLLTEKFGWRWRNSSTPSAHASWTARASQWFVNAGHLPRWTLHIAMICIGGYILAIGFTASLITPDVAWLAGGAGALLATSVAVSLGRSGTRLAWLMQAALYVGAVVAIYLDPIMPTDHPLVLAAKWVLLPILVAAVVLRLRLSGDRRFQVTPLDVLLLIIALVLPTCQTSPVPPVSWD